MGSREASKITDLLCHLKAGEPAVVDQLFTAVYKNCEIWPHSSSERKRKGLRFSRRPW